MTVDGCVGWILAVLPAGLLALGGLGVIAPYASLQVRVLAIAGAAFGLWAAPSLMRGYGFFARSMLAPTGQAELALRVRHLDQTRTEALHTGAAEIRRIERDLHDGAQARLVAMGMTLDAAGQIIDTNPVAARALLIEARDASVKALAELRDLVRGIHPPVLADRGLAEAIRALALDSPMRIHVASDADGRPPTTTTGGSSPSSPTSAADNRRFVCSRGRYDTRNCRRIFLPPSPGPGMHKISPAGQ